MPHSLQVQHQDIAGLCSYNVCKEALVDHTSLCALYTSCSLYWAVRCSPCQENIDEFWGRETAIEALIELVAGAKKGMPMKGATTAGDRTLPRTPKEEEAAESSLR